MEINNEIIDKSCEDSFLKTNYELEAKEIYINCSRESMNKLLDLLPDGCTEDVFILNIAKYLGFTQIGLKKEEKNKDTQEAIYLKYKYLCTTTYFVKLITLLLLKDTEIFNKFTSDYVEIFRCSLNKMKKELEEKEKDYDAVHNLLNKFYVLETNNIYKDKLKKDAKLSACLKCGYFKLTTCYEFLPLNTQIKVIILLENIINTP